MKPFRCGFGGQSLNPKAETVNPTWGLGIQQLLSEDPLKSKGKPEFREPKHPKP